MQNPTTLDIQRDGDIIIARQEGRKLAKDMGFGLADQTRIATAISELVRNVVKYADRGTISLNPITKGEKEGLEVIVRDEGAGIEDIDLAMEDNYSTAGSLGMGLPGARRLVHEFDIDSQPGHGTTVTFRMWLR